MAKYYITSGDLKLTVNAEDITKAKQKALEICKSKNISIDKHFLISERGFGDIENLKVLSPQYEIKLIYECENCKTIYRIPDSVMRKDNFTLVCQDCGEEYFLPKIEDIKVTILYPKKE